jgi:hypothetical protein
VNSHVAIARRGAVSRSEHNSYFTVMRFIVATLVTPSSEQHGDCAGRVVILRMLSFKLVEILVGSHIWTETIHNPLNFMHYGRVTIFICWMLHS